MPTFPQFQRQRLCLRQASNQPHLARGRISAERACLRSWRIVMKLHRRQFLHLAAGAVALPAVSRLAWRRTYPTRPVRFVVGFPAGNASDILARLMGQWLSERLGQNFVIDNRPGAGSNIGTEVVVVRAAGRLHAASGRRVERNQCDALRKAQLRFHSRHSTGREHLRQPLSSWWSRHHFRPRRFPSSSPTRSPIRARSTWRRPAIGSPTHVLGELFKTMTGVDMVHVPYRSSFVPDLLGGQVQVVFAPITHLIALYPRRQAARPCGDDCDALGGAAGHPDRGRICAGIRGHRLVRHRRAEKHARRDHRQTQ